MNSVEHFFSSEDEMEDENLVRNRNLVKIRRKIREESDPFSLPDSKFVQFFRLNKDAFRYLLDEIASELKISPRSTSVSPVLKLAATLRILSEGAYQHGAGNDFNLGLAQSTMSNILKEVVDVIESKLCPKWVNMDLTEESKRETKLWFFEKFGIPGVIGCVDGTHIRIITPQKSEQNLYLNRKGFYSLNAMIVCDHNMVIRCIDARHPGSSHDSLIWKTSELRTFLKSEFERGERNSWLLGDSGYPLEPFLMTPFRLAEEGSPQSKYNSAHTKARNIVERTIGVLKNRFRCLLGARQLHYSPSKAIQFANVCAALHNVCIHFKVATTFGVEIQQVVEPIAAGENVAVNDQSYNEIALNSRLQIMNAL